MTTPGDKTPQAEGATKGNVAPGSATPGNGPSGSTNQAGATAGSPAAPGTPPGGTPTRATTTTDLPAPGGERDPGDSTWIYDQLGLSPEEYKGDPAPDAANLPSSAELRRRAAALNLDYDALRPGDPNESAFPPGSLGGGGIDPPTRKWEGFGAATANLPAQAEPPAAAPPATPATPTATPTAAPATPPPAAAAPSTPANPAVPAAPAVPKAPIKGARPVRPARSAQPAGEPFKDYDAKQATGDIQLPTHGQSAQPASRQPQSVRPAARNLPVSTEKLSADSLTADKVLKQRKKAASKGWRKGVMAATGGLVNLGPGAKERRSLEFEDRVRTEIPGCHRLAVISLKGGVGKTTTAAALGSMFASLRGDRVIAIDANPDRGTLGDKIVPGMAKSTVRDFVSRSAQLDRYSAVREFTAQAESRLEVLVSESDPLASLAFSENDYRIISDILERFYNLILTDCGTGLLHSAMVGVLAKADQVVIVSSASLDGARSASATLDWLEAHNYSELARESVTVVTSVRPQAATVHLDEIIGHFAKRTRAVVAVPYDPHLAEGGQIDLSSLGKGAYQAYLELAAEIADQFPRLGLGKHG
jgi:MinD-like ATPase involved in chromosome partitioning or flagellar assembly